jgi:hypothetical protein
MEHVLNSSYSLAREVILASDIRLNDILLRETPS